MNSNPTRKTIYNQTIKKVKQEEKTLSELRKVRDELNHIVKTNFEEARVIRLERDEYNNQVKSLKKKRNELNKQKKEIKVATDEDKSITQQAMKYHKDLRKLASQSQECQVDMVGKIREARTTRTKADETHSKVKEQVSIIKKLRAQIKMMQKEAIIEYEERNIET